MSNIRWQFPQQNVFMSSLSSWCHSELPETGKLRGKTCKIEPAEFRFQALHWIDVSLVCRCFGSSYLEVWLVLFLNLEYEFYKTQNIYFFKNTLFKQYFVVRKICLSQSIRSFKKAILYPSQHADNVSSSKARRVAVLLDRELNK